MLEVGGGLYLVCVHFGLAFLQLQLPVQPGHPLQELHHSNVALFASQAVKVRHELLEGSVITPGGEHIRAQTSVVVHGTAPCCSL